MNYQKEANFIAVIKNGLKTESRTLSVKTLLSERNLKKIDYKPYYQRNYVWDSEKQSFFIESVLLGTEIPPLILYKSGMKTEVIDGRQRFETLKRFKENDFYLDEKGLVALPALKKKTFNKLEDDIKEVFLNANIRIFEFEVIGEIAPDIEDKLKKEIFQRYNTGVTPLTMVEIDGAKYCDDDFSNEIETTLTEDTIFFEHVRKCLFPTNRTKETADLRKKMVDKLRRTYVLPKFPISKYATGVNRSNISEILYQSAIQQLTDDVDKEVKKYKSILDKVFNLYDAYETQNKSELKNKFFYEALIWVALILDQENIQYDFIKNINDIFNFYKQNESIFSEENSFFYINIIGRFTATAKFFHKLYGFDFSEYIRNDDFTQSINESSQSKQDVKNVVQELESLRTNKPSPISKTVEDIISDLLTNKYLIRPPYQRQEKISINKASSIIESILLKIPLPPIFVYLRKDGVKEVVDGQQRLLSILAFLGKQYKNENGKMEYSRNNNFKLKNLVIRKDLNGQNDSALTENDRDQILDFYLDEIVIDAKLNEKFDPTDLFIRLNQKPYPIKQNSFEMWNSIVDKDIIERIKEITQTHLSWFFSSDINDATNRTDRMENEELITLLTYIDLILTKENSYEKVLGMFKRIDRITCRVKDKKTITEYLSNLESDPAEKNIFIKTLNETESKINYFGSLFEDGGSKNSLNEFINVKKARTFRRSYQDFYIIWLVLHYADYSESNKHTVKENISNVLKLLRNANNENVDENYYSRFMDKIRQVTKKE